jgi:alkanesulfonate monooxygenase SsuD/methylene tetrahydromethanopterin reductase-like flavin-dependent oxidoreductase (luciferase family)
VHADLLLNSFGSRWPDVQRVANAAVDAGFAGIWTFDHIDGRVYDARDVLECWTTLGALAATVPDVTIGPLVTNVTHRHPAILAAMSATLQEVSGGRLVLGLGAGTGPGTRYAREDELIGLPTYGDAERRALVEQCIAEMRRLWRTPGILHPAVEPPLVVGGFGPKMAEVAGRVGDGINTRATHPRLEELITVARDAHAASGRDREQFLVTAFTEFDEGWLPIESPPRARLAALGVDRLVLIVDPTVDVDRITAAAHLLRA